MKITIEPQKFLEVLLYNGMSEPEAKALLYDLIMESNGVPVKREATTHQPTQHHEGDEESEEAVGTTPVAPVRMKTESAPEQSEGEEHFEVESVTKEAPRLRKPVRMNFSQFGGTEEPLR